MAKLSILDLDLVRKRVFIRVDFNVPIKDGKITDDTRIRSSMETIQFALAHGATAVVASHLGRPKGKPNPAMSLRPVADRLAELAGRPVVFTDDCVGDAVKQQVDQAHASGAGLVLLENLRFHPEEEKNDPEFAKQLASLADLYVDDAFGAAHRAHASVEGITHYLQPAAAGLLMERELKYLGQVLEAPEKPFVAILGGAKVSDKIEVIENMLGRVDRLIIGGAMAYTFFKAQGLPVGRSLVEDDLVDTAKSLLDRAERSGIALELPIDHVVAPKLEATSPSQTLDVGDKAIGDRMGLDIGPKTVSKYSGIIQRAKTVVWNGPMGVFEMAPFAAGTMGVARAVAAVHGTTIIGGGDSVSAVTQAGVADQMTHISTGGGASLEFLAGRTLPGVVALQRKAAPKS